MTTNNNDDDQMESAVSDVLTYFAVFAGNENTTQKRREFARHAGNLVVEASETLGDYLSGKERMRERRGIAEYVLTSKKQTRQEYNALLKNIRDELKSPAKLASDIKSIYEKEDELFMELAKNELISDDKAGEEIEDKTYVGRAINNIGVVNYALLNKAQIAFMNKVSKFVEGGYVDVGYVKSAKDYADRFNEAMTTSAAAVAAISEVIDKGRKVTKNEFLELKEKYNQQLGAARDSVVKQMEDMVKNRAKPVPDYDGAMFA